jgi:hypothetical protein
LKIIRKLPRQTIEELVFKGNTRRMQSKIKTKRRIKFKLGKIVEKNKYYY